METRLLSARSPADLDEAAALLRRGGLVAFPTETVYGLGALALEPLAVRAIYAAKSRPLTNPLIVHVLGEDEARPLFSRWPMEARQLAARFWPGPLTLVLPRTAIVPDECTAGGDTVGVRAPSHPAARGLLQRVGAPLAAPSFILKVLLPRARKSPMMGTWTSCFSKASKMCGTAAAAASLFTVTRTNSEPAWARAAIWRTVPATSAVSVLVMDCTTTGASLPTRTAPTLTVTVFLR